jgi:hypothetical protein
LDLTTSCSKPGISVGNKTLEEGVSRQEKRVKGIEPSLEAWEATVLPLNHTRGVKDLAYCSLRKELNTKNIPGQAKLKPHAVAQSMGRTSKPGTEKEARARMKKTRLFLKQKVDFETSSGVASRPWVFLLPGRGFR